MAVEATRQTHPSDEIWVSVGLSSKQNTNAYAYGQGRQVLQRFPRLRDAISESVNPNHGTSGAILTHTSPPSPPATNENRNEDRTKDANLTNTDARQTHGQAEGPRGCTLTN